MTRHFSQDDRQPTLCAPDAEKSCFACCPPIRPAEYDHIQHRTIIQRILRENTRNFDHQNRDPHPITGFSCWALGYTDDACGLVGCLLHPARHQGRDLRSLVDYGDKCRRENCPESKAFLALSAQTRCFWLRLAQGLDSFQYSSRRFNPLFHILGWGPVLLGFIASETRETDLTRDNLPGTYPILATDLDPRANAYLLERIVLNSRFSRIGTEIFSRKFEQFSGGIMTRLRKAPCETNAPYTHLLPLDPLFVNLLRLGAGIRRIREDAARSLQTDVDTALHHFINRLD
jgi:hypothetical protein